MENMGEKCGRVFNLNLKSANNHLEKSTYEAGEERGGVQEKRRK